MRHNITLMILFVLVASSAFAQVPPARGPRSSTPVAEAAKQTEFKNASKMDAIKFVVALEGATVVFDATPDGTTNEDVTGLTTGQAITKILDNPEQKWWFDVGPKAYHIVPVKPQASSRPATTGSENRPLSYDELVARTQADARAEWNARETRDQERIRVEQADARTREANASASYQQLVARTQADARAEWIARERYSYGRPIGILGGSGWNWWWDPAYDVCVVEPNHWMCHWGVLKLDGPSTNLWFRAFKGLAGETGSSLENIDVYYEEQNPPEGEQALRGNGGPASKRDSKVNSGLPLRAGRYLVKFVDIKQNLTFYEDEITVIARWFSRDEKGKYTPSILKVNSNRFDHAPFRGTIQSEVKTNQNARELLRGK